MKLKYHIGSSGIMSSIVYIFTNSYLSSIACFLAGVLIDLDHLIDYYLNYGFTYQLGKIYKTMAELKVKKVYVFLHSFEILCGFWGFIFLIPLNNIWLAIAIGLTQHIILDQIFNPVVSKGYFLSYRIRQGFRKEGVLNINKP